MLGTVCLSLPVQGWAVHTTPQHQNRSRIPHQTAAPVTPELPHSYAVNQAPTQEPSQTLTALTQSFLCESREGCRTSTGRQGAAGEAIMSCPGALPKAPAPNSSVPMTREWGLGGGIGGGALRKLSLQDGAPAGGAGNSELRRDHVPSHTWLEPRFPVGTGQLHSRATCPDGAGSWAQTWLLSTWQVLVLTDTPASYVWWCSLPSPRPAETPFHVQGTTACQRKCTREKLKN